MMVNIFENIILLVCVLDLFSIAKYAHVLLCTCISHIWFACQPHVVHMWVTVTCGSHVKHMWVTVTCESHVFLRHVVPISHVIHM